MEPTDIKTDYTYFTNDRIEPIEALESHKDLGVHMSDNGGFENHIDITIKKAKKKIGWICRTFMSRDAFFMKKIYIAQVRPILNYCVQLWSPLEGPLMDKLEKVQYHFTNLIPELRNFYSKTRLSKLKMLSVQRRINRYRILYTRKIFLNKVPNPGICIRNDEYTRNGLKLEVPTRKGQSLLRAQNFLVRGPSIFNCLPKKLRNLEKSMDSYKIELDEYLGTLNDTPRIGEGSKQASNELDFIIKHQKWCLKP